MIGHPIRCLRISRTLARKTRDSGVGIRDSAGSRPRDSGVGIRDSTGPRPRDSGVGIRATPGPRRRDSGVGIQDSAIPGTRRTRIPNAKSRIPTAFTPRERRLIATLRTPAAVQAYLNALPYNQEPGGRATLRSFRGVVREGCAHCLEAALFSTVVLETHGHPPFVLSFQSIDALDHGI